MSTPDGRKLKKKHTHTHTHKLHYALCLRKTILKFEVNNFKYFENKNVSAEYFLNQHCLNHIIENLKGQHRGR